MEDRYLFKAKRIDNGEWVQGYLFDDGFENGKIFIGGLVIEEYNGTACDDWNITGIDFYEVDPSTICQCTGMKDKNGKLIWEDDIVRDWGDTDDFGNDLYYFYKVVWNKDLCCWWLSDIYTQEDEYLYICLKEIDVIGNIFDNPELLEGGE